MRGMQGMEMGHPSSAHGPAGAAPNESARVAGQQPMGDMGMRPGPLGIPMTRQGSGTSWLPDAAPMHAYHFRASDWEFMIHGAEDFVYDRQSGGDRGDAQFLGAGWLMGMATHPLGEGRVSARGMFSADPWTATNRGYPLVLQSGEAYNGAPLHDRQHPHNLFMEIAGVYETAVTRDVGLQLYAGPVGEPAVGPVAFPHRPSASSDPFAPLSHHWQDATHIAFGVLTTGLFTRTIKLEGSIFNGREPNQHRAEIELRTPHDRTLDSYSGRLTVNPSDAWSVSTWYAYLHSPEQLEPHVAQHRFGASLLKERPLGAHGQWSSALVYGANAYSNDRRISNSAVVETNAALDATNTLFGRIEYVNKAPGDLAVPSLPPPAPNRFDIYSLSIGYVRELGAFTRFGTVGAGVDVTLDAIPATLEPVYRTRTPGGLGIFLRIRPAHAHGEHMGQAMQMSDRAAAPEP
jgi:hypothetical protein